MKVAPERLILLQSFAPKQRGIFSSRDLANLYQASSRLELSRYLKPFLKAGILRRYCRGFYVTEAFDLEVLSQRLSPGSALSLGTVLAKEQLIGNIPQKTVYGIKIGKTRRYRSPLGNVFLLAFSSSSLGRRLWFGYDNWKDGIRHADKEKAFLDTLYFYQLGAKFSFNVYSDIAVERLDRKKIKDYLSRYRNPKFVAFVKGVLNGNRSIG